MDKTWRMEDRGAYLELQALAGAHIGRLPMAVLATMAESKAKRLLIDARGLGKENGDHYVDEDDIYASAKFVQAAVKDRLWGIAILGRERIMDTLKLYGATWSPAVDTRVFTDPDEATAWLLTWAPRGYHKKSRAAMTPQEVRQARNSLGMTQQQFAQALGVTQSAVSFWEQGDRTVDARTAKLINFILESSNAKKGPRF